MATVEVESTGADAALMIESDSLCLINLQSKANALVGGTSAYAIYSDDIMEAQPTLHFNSTMNSLLAVQPNSTTQQMLVYSAVNTTFQTGPPLNLTDWEYRGVANMTDFNQTVHTVGHMHGAYLQGGLRGCGADSANTKDHRAAEYPRRAS